MLCGGGVRVLFVVLYGGGVADCRPVLYGGGVVVWYHKTRLGHGHGVGHSV